MKSAKLVLADDHPLMLMAMRAIVGNRHNVMGTCENGKDLVALAGKGDPDVVITDIDMPELNGVDAAADILAIAPRLRVIFYTAKANQASFQRAMSIGAHGYVLKSDPAESLLAAIECVLNGKQYVSAPLGHLQAELVASSQPRPDLSTLTARQLEILRLISQGAGNKQIAHDLGLSIKTVEFHRANLTHRYGKHSIAELLVLAARQGLISDPGNGTEED
ncbi:MAG: response regulator [Planctomycetota bacterium]